MSKKLKILLYADCYGGRIGINNSYVSFFEQFGEVILVHAQNDVDFFIQHADVLALPGGADVDPARYHESPGANMDARVNPQYEWLDLNLLARWIPTKKPIIGICRGLQTLNVSLGGSLHQHIVGHVGDEKRDSLDFYLFSEIPGYNIYETNSYHHQGIKKLADGFDVLAWSTLSKNCPSLKQSQFFRHIYEKTKSGIKKVTTTIGVGVNAKEVVVRYHALPEIIQHRELPYLAFQYHPEEFNCELAIMLINKVLGTDVMPIKELQEKQLSYVA